MKKIFSIALSLFILSCTKDSIEILEPVAVVVKEQVVVVTKEVVATPTPVVAAIVISAEQEIKTLKNNLVSEGFLAASDQVYSVHYTDVQTRYYIQADATWKSFTVSTNKESIGVYSSLALAIEAKKNHLSGLRSTVIGISYSTSEEYTEGVDVNRDGDLSDNISSQNENLSNGTIRYGSWVVIANFPPNHVDLVEIGWVFQDGYYDNQNYPKWTLTRVSSKFSLSIPVVGNVPHVVEVESPSEIENIVLSYVEPYSIIRLNYIVGPVEGVTPNQYRKVSVTMDNPNGREFSVAMNTIKCEGGYGAIAYKGFTNTNGELVSKRTFGKNISPNYGNNFTYSYKAKIVEVLDGNRIELILFSVDISGPRRIGTNNHNCIVGETSIRDFEYR